MFAIGVLLWWACPIGQALTAVAQPPTRTAWQYVAGNVTECLIQSDRKRNAGNDGASTGWTSWVDEASAGRLQTCIDDLFLSDNLSWLCRCPEPMVMELSPELQKLMSPELQERVGCHMFILPSGMSLDKNLRSPPGAMVYGKALLGGVTRFRVLNSQRRAGERTVIVSPGHDATDGWMQYGGPDRNYEAVDMGSCIFMEVTLLPVGLEIAENPCASTMYYSPFDINRILSMENKEDPTDNGKVGTSEISMGVCDLEAQFCASIGGLQEQIDQIVRRVLDGRVFRQISESEGTTASELDKTRRTEMESLLELGLHPVRGMLLYGPPGCGKTALAREIGSILDARPPKIVAAPELLDRWVGGSEKMVRELFVDAEKELRVCNGDPTKSALHVIVIDEIDAVFRKRGNGSDSAEATRASVVNQILTKLDGMKSLGNTLVIGMTNRIELLDPALIRPGRLEVLVEIPLPDQSGRKEILNLHFCALRERGRLSLLLCSAIDGSLKEGRKQSWFGEKPVITDLSADRWTGGFSGADIAGLVRNAGSLALARTREANGVIPDDIIITLDDVHLAIQEAK